MPGKNRVILKMKFIASNQLVRSVLNLRDRHVAIPNVLTLLSCVVHGVGNYFVSNIFFTDFHVHDF